MNRFAFLLVAIASVLPAADPKLTAEERQKLLDLLEDSRAKLLEAVAGLSPAQWTYQPAPERWSVGLVAEHMMRTEAGLFRKAEEALANPANPDWEAKTKGKTEFLERIMPTRQGKAQAPVEVRPEGKLTREEILGQFDELRGRLQKLVRDTDPPLKAHTAEHFMKVFGTLSAHQWLLYIPWHTQRHLKQMAEVKADAGYPKN